MQITLNPQLLVPCMFCLAFGLAAYPSNGSSPTDFAGNWVMKLGQRNFIVLKLWNENSHWMGTLSRPKHFGTSDGRREGGANYKAPEAEGTRRISLEVYHRKVCHWLWGPKSGRACRLNELS
jgi:hypothetical protein